MSRLPGAESPVHRILLISLERQPRRRAEFFERLQCFPSLHDRVEWLPAVDGALLDLDQVPGEIVTAAGVEDAKMPRDKVIGYVLTRGAIGLALSLHKALGLIAGDTDDSHVYLLCEDDAHLHPEFLQAISDLLEATTSLDPAWEVLHVGYHPACTTVEPCGLGDIGIPTELFGMYGLALPPRGARALLRCLFPVSMQVDTELSRAYQHLRKVEGEMHVRANSLLRATGACLRAYAPRNSPPDRPEHRWRGPIVVAPPSQGDCTDIQVINEENFALQYLQRVSRRVVAGGGLTAHDDREQRATRLA